MSGLTDTMPTKVQTKLWKSMRRAIVNDGIRDCRVNPSVGLQGQFRPGQAVALNQRTFVVVDVVSEPEEPVRM